MVWHPANTLRMSSSFQLPFFFSPAHRCACSHLRRFLRCFSFLFSTCLFLSDAWAALLYARVFACTLVSLSRCCCCCRRRRSDRRLLCSSAFTFSSSRFSLLCLYVFGLSCSPSHISLPLSQLLIAFTTAPRQTLPASFLGACVFCFFGGALSLRMWASAFSSP